MTGLLPAVGAISMEPICPGENASVRETLALAAQYEDAAVKLGEAAPKSVHLPLRLLALHSIELFLNALLLAKGLDHQTVRSLHHDLGEQSRIAMCAGLVLRKRTAAHLRTLSSSREYQVIRYVPALTSSLSQPTRMMATLDEVSKKVRKMLGPRPSSQRRGSPSAEAAIIGRKHD